MHRYYHIAVLVCCGSFQNIRLSRLLKWLYVQFYAYNMAYNLNLMSLIRCTTARSLYISFGSSLYRLLHCLSTHMKSKNPFVCVSSSRTLWTLEEGFVRLGQWTGSYESSRTIKLRFSYCFYRIWSKLIPQSIEWAVAFNLLSVLTFDPRYAGQCNPDAVWIWL